MSHSLLAAITDLHAFFMLLLCGTAILAAVYIACFRTILLVRLPLWILCHTIYRLRVHGAENIPETGPMLLVSNHVSYIDAILIMAAAKRRVRFLVWAPFMGVPGLRLLLRLADVIPIQGTSGPRAIMQALRTASEALAAGEVVCIFAEGSITRTGLTLTFQRGFQQIVKRSPACIDYPTHRSISGEEDVEWQSGMTRRSPRRRHWQTKRRDSTCRTLQICCPARRARTLSGF